MKARTTLVIGGGVAGLAAAWSLSKRGEHVLLLERGSRLGGLVESERPMPGVLIEHGPDALLADKPGGMRVLEQLGLAETRAPLGEAPRRAYVARPEGLTALPAGLFAFERRALFTMLASPLLSASAKLRLTTEPTRRASVHHAGDESVESFFSRRMGPEVEQNLVAPMLRGIYGASSRELSVRAVFPKLVRMEEGFGSIGIALLFARRSVRQHGLVALEGGMESIPQALGREILCSPNARIALSSAVRSITREGRLWRVTLEDGRTLEADALVLATDVSTSALLLRHVAPSLAEALGAIRSTDAEVVTLVYPRTAMTRRLDATGFVVDDARRRTLACTFASEKWKGRAPAELCVFRSVLKGASELSDDAIVREAHSELEGFLGFQHAPTLTRLRRRRLALPVYGVGHARKILEVRKLLAALGGIALAGNYLGGIGVPDSIQSGLEASAQTFDAFSAV